MTRKEFITLLAERNQLSMRDAEAALSGMIEMIMDTVAGGSNVQFTGFGVFGARNRDARCYTDPRTGEKSTAEQTTVPFFKASTGFKKYVAEVSAARLSS